MRTLLRRPSPAMVVACLALFLAGTGTGVAVINALPAGSVGTAQLKANAVVSSKVKNNSLKAVDFASGQLPKGAKGSTGATGAAGATNVVVVTALGGWSTRESRAEAYCSAGQVATGGGIGWNASGDTLQVSVTHSFPEFDYRYVPNGWGGIVSNYGTEGTLQAIAFAICASP